MDANKPMLHGVTEGEEHDRLGELFAHGEVLLMKWSAYEPTRNAKSADAVVAVMNMQKQIVERRNYLLAKLTQEKLPF